MFFSRKKQSPGSFSEPAIPPKAYQAQPPKVESNTKMWVRWLIVFGFIGLFLLFYHFALSSTSQTPEHSVSQNSDGPKNPQRIRLIATGDFIAHDTLNLRAKKPHGSYDYLQFMRDFEPIFANADIRFCNQATVSAGGDFGISGYPVFNAPQEFAKDMAKLGCNLINNASNHSFDKGQGAINATLDVWHKTPNLLAVAGENRSPEEQNTIHYFTIKGVKFAFLAYTTYSNTPPPNKYGVNMYSEELAKNQIQASRQNGAQIIIVSMRWGTEYSADINDGQKNDSQFLADQGVDVILGHGPHVLEPADLLQGGGGNQTFVWYSLGNFLNTQEPIETLFNGLAVMDFDTKTKKIIDMGYLPIYMHYEWSPSQKTKDDLLARSNLHLYLLEDANQSLIDNNQLSTTINAQKSRIKNTLNTYTKVSLLTKSEFFQ